MSGVGCFEQAVTREGKIMQVLSITILFVAFFFCFLRSVQRDSSQIKYLFYSVKNKIKIKMGAIHGYQPIKK